MDYKIFILILVIVAITVFARIWLFRSSAKWQSASGHIEKSVIVRYQNPEQQAPGRTTGTMSFMRHPGQIEYILDMSYEYEVAGKRYKAISIAPDFARSNILSLSKHTVASASLGGSKAKGLIVPLTESDIAYIKANGDGDYDSDPNYLVPEVNSYSSIQTVVDIQKQFARGSTVAVHYNPDNPEQASLIAKEASSNKVIFILTVFAIAVMAIVFGIMKFAFK